MSKRDSTTSRKSDTNTRKHHGELESDNLNILQKSATTLSPIKRRRLSPKRNDNVEKEPMLVSPSKKSSEDGKYRRVKKTTRRHHPILLRNNQQNQILMNKIIANFSEDDGADADADEFEDLDDDGLFNFFGENRPDLSSVHLASKSEQTLSNLAPFLNKNNTTSKSRLDVPANPNPPTPQLQTTLQHEQTLRQTGKLRAQLTMSPASISLTSMAREAPIIRPLSPPQFSQKRQQSSSKLQAIKDRQHQLKYPLGDNVPSEFEDSSDEVELSSQIDLPKKFLPSNIPRSTTISKPSEFLSAKPVSEPPVSLRNSIPENNNKLIAESLTRFDSGDLTTNPLVTGDVSPKISSPGVGSPSGSHKTYDINSVRGTSPLPSQTISVSENNEQHDLNNPIEIEKNEILTTEPKEHITSRLEFNDNDDTGSEIDTEATILKVESFIKRKREELNNLTNDSFAMNNDILVDEGNEVRVGSSKDHPNYLSSSALDGNANEQQQRQQLEVSSIRPKRVSLKRKRSDIEPPLEDSKVEDLPPHRKKARVSSTSFKRNLDYSYKSREQTSIRMNYSNKKAPFSEQETKHSPLISKLPIFHGKPTNSITPDQYTRPKTSTISGSNESRDNAISSINSQSSISSTSKPRFQSFLPIGRRGNGQQVLNEKDPFISPNSSRLKRELTFERTIPNRTDRPTNVLSDSVSSSRSRSIETSRPGMNFNSKASINSTRHPIEQASSSSPPPSQSPPPQQQLQSLARAASKKRETDWTKEQWMKLYNYVMTWFYSKNDDHGTFDNDLPKLDINQVQNEFGCSIKELKIRIKELQKLIDKKIRLQERDELKEILDS